jgi:thiosulfate dehydrogenase (quinone) large subunit
MSDRTRLAVQQLERPTDLAPEPVQLANQPGARPASSPPASDRPGAVKEQKVSHLLFHSRAAAPLWLAVRLWLGYEWFTAGWQKLHATGPASWFGDAPALRGFVHGADAIWANRAQAFGHPQVHYAWFLNFLDFVGNHASIMGPVVVFSEILIGLGLMTGVLTRWAALGGVMLNVLYICGGSAGPNGVFIVAGVLLLCAWRVAGHLGGDRIIIDLLARPSDHVPAAAEQSLSTRRARTIGKRLDPPYDANDLPTSGNSHR